MHMCKHAFSSIHPLSHPLSSFILHPRALLLVRRYAMSSIRVPEPVMSLALTPKASDQLPNFMRALQRFQKEDPTFRVGGCSLAVLWVVGWAQPGGLLFVRTWCSV